MTEIYPGGTPKHDIIERHGTSETDTDKVLSPAGDGGVAWVNMSAAPLADHDIVSKHTTTEMDTSKVLSPDGAGGVAWGTAGAGDMTKAIYDTDDNGIVDNAEAVGGTSLAGINAIIDNDIAAHAGLASVHHVRYSDAEASAAAPVQSVDGATGAVDLSGSYEALGAVATHAAITDAHHDPVTLAGAYDYLSITGQQITLGQIDLTTDVTGQLPAANIGAHASTHESGGADGINHNALTNYDTNEHIDHTSVTLTAGDGLTGGGTIAASRSFALNTPGTLSAASANDASGNHTHAVTASSDVSAGTDSLLESDANGDLTLANLYVPDGGFMGISGADGWTFDGTNGDISTTSNVGIGTTGSGYKLEVKDSGVTTFLNRVTSLIADTRTAMALMHSTSNDMADGFGPIINFAIKDNAGVTNFIGNIGAIRDGSDDRGKIQLKTTFGIMVMDKDGNVGINETDPAYRLDIDDGAMRYAEMTAPSAPAANSFVQYAEDAGSDTAACIKFNGGHVVTIAIDGGIEDYNPSNVTADRTFDADSTTLAEIADVLGTLIMDLQKVGTLGEP